MLNVLSVRDLEAWYGESKALHGLDCDVRPGEVVTLLGRNGAGKTTTLKSIMGLISRRAGSIKFEGEELIKRKANYIACRGIAFCPEERGIFANLSVSENLMLPPRVKPGGLSEADVLELFPNLLERMSMNQGTKLSGGEQQMLAIARILRTGAKLLLLDEPTEGLAPLVIQQIAVTIQKLKSLGYTILLVEQNIAFARELADRHYVVESGRVVDEIPTGDFDNRFSAIQRYLCV